MDTQARCIELLDKLEFQYAQYSRELRATTQPYYLENVEKAVAGYTYRPEDRLVRETLLEHIGSLPMVATTFYPYINDPSVDLGRALTMLAIHDIGELTTGDEITFTKQSSTKDPEREAALKLLDPRFHELYDEIENRTSNSARFAKAIDKITPDILDYLTPAEVTIIRFKHFVGIDDVIEIVPLIKKHKHPYMLWNRFMTEFHLYLLEKIEEKLRQ